MTQLSYYRSDPQQPTALPRPLLLSSILVVALGLFHAYPAMKILLGLHSAAFLFQMSSSWIESAVWAVIFILIGIAIGRACRWIRPILLGVLPAYIMINIGQAMVDIWLHQGFMVFPAGLPGDFAHIAALVLAGAIFAWFCTPQIDGAFMTAGAKSSRLAELPLPLSSWAIFCIAFGSLGLVQTFLFMARDIGIRPMQPRYLLLSSIIACGGALSLSRKRYALIAASLCLLMRPIPVVVGLIFFRQPVGRTETNDIFFIFIIPAVHAVLNLAAALFGFYAARFLKQPSENDPSV